VLVRREAQELLVASGYEPLNDDGFTKLLEVYDLRGYSMELKRTVPVPNRVNCTTYCQPMVLSRDERYLYYATRTTAPECGGGGNAAVCDIHHIVVLDLEDVADSPAAIELPRGCGVPELSVSGENSAVVTCRGQYPVKGGFTQRVGPAGGEEVLDLGFGSPVHVFTMPDGRVVHLTEQGLVKVFGDDGAFEGAQVLPPSDAVGFGPRVYYLGATELGEERLFITFDDSGFVSHDQGFVVFDLRTMNIEGYGLVPGATAYLPQGEVVYVLRSGKLHVLDLASGRLSELAGVSGGVEVLLPGR
jgi:hypothetical protein